MKNTVMNMGVIQERIYFDEIDIGNELTVYSWGEGVERDPHRNISLRVDELDEFTPEELIMFGGWLIEQGNRIKRDYNEKGEPIYQEGAK